MVLYTLLLDYKVDRNNRLLKLVSKGILNILLENLYYLLFHCLLPHFGIFMACEAVTLNTKMCNRDGVRRIPQ